VGRTLRLNGRPHTIIGVMPPRFGWYGNDGFWLPLSPTRPDLPWINPIVRLAPGVSSTVAEAQLRALHERLALEKPATFPAQGFTTRLRNYLDVTVASGEMRTSLQLLLGAVAFLLLIACANVANLQLARGTRGARDGGAHVDWRRSPAFAAPTADRKRPVIARRRSARCALRARCHPQPSSG
jgi:hypothetical protein